MTVEEIIEDCIIVPSVQHTGMHFLREVLGGRQAKMRFDDLTIRYSEKLPRPYEIIHGHFDNRTPLLKALSDTRKTVIPLRHPMKVAVSWKKRGAEERRTPTFLDQWLRMDEFSNAFFFPLEVKPFTALEKYIGRPVIRTTEIYGAQEYDYPDDVEAFLGGDMFLVELALKTKIGKRFYA